MIFNVAQLLRSPVGASRQHRWNGEYEALNRELGLEGSVDGSVRMDRTNWGILCTARMNGGVRLQCSRCLESFSQDLPIRLCEEFVPTADVRTGLQTPGPSDIHDFTIDESHILDLTDAFRQYGLLSKPAQPLCHPGCRGLCPTCGGNRNHHQCSCMVEEVDPRLQTLQSWFGSSRE
jgi:uncharacterized protein